MRALRVLAVLPLLGLTVMARPVLAADAAVYQITATSEVCGDEFFYLVVVSKDSEILLAILDSGGVTWTYGIGAPKGEQAEGTMFGPATEHSPLGPFALRFTPDSVAGTIQTICKRRAS